MYADNMTAYEGEGQSRYMVEEDKWVEDWLYKMTKVGKNSRLSHDINKDIQDNKLKTPEEAKKWARAELKKRGERLPKGWVVVDL